MRRTTLGATYSSVCFSNTGVCWKSSSKSSSDDDDNDDDVLTLIEPMLYSRHCAKGVCVYIYISHLTLKKNPVRYQYIGRLDNLPVVCHKAHILNHFTKIQTNPRRLYKYKERVLLTLNI